MLGERTDVNADLSRLIAPKDLVDFAKTLETLARKQGWQGEFHEMRLKSGRQWDLCRAVSIRHEKQSFILVVVRSFEQTIPGREMLTVLLLDGQGRFKDRFSCEINSRLTRMHTARFHALIHAELLEGAHIVMRLDDMSVRGNFTHTLHHGNRQESFLWGNTDLPPQKATPWDLNGLCRLAIHEGRLRVLFPKMKE